MTRILVVDDEVDTLDVLRLFLELSGYEAITTLNSQDAITLAEVERPDCALLDVMMPGLDGFSLCKMMRTHPLTKNLPIMFVTAYSPMDLEERRVDAGADMVLPKPFGMDSLIGAVEKLMFIHASKATESLPAPEVTVAPDVKPDDKAVPSPGVSPNSEPAVKPDDKAVPGLGVGQHNEPEVTPDVRPDDKGLVVRKDAPADAFAQAMQQLISAVAVSDDQQKVAAG
jgi:CheY-like chemotaxis protein